uniref:Uncharacterized protein n=1 Tax=Rhizophora mucronata TaxID=61149 RepID=A0A2P2QIU1_RHIMU
MYGFFLGFVFFCNTSCYNYGFNVGERENPVSSQ